jgi:MFS family permease
MVIPLSKLMDKIRGESDEYLFVALGTFLMSAIPLFYIISSEAWHIYLLQALNGMAASMAVPAWRILFTNHADRSIVGFEWSLEDAGVGIATASSAIVGALVVDKFGFNTLFCMIFLFGTLSTIVLLTLYKNKKMASKKLVRIESSEAPLKIDSFK